MKDHSPQVSHSVNLMLLLLILSMPLVAVHSFLYPRSDQHDYHENSDTFLDYEDWDSRKTMEEEAEETLQYCDGDFDVYFIFDKSKAVEEWADMFTAWEDMVEKYVNPNLRMSFILFDSKATVQMALTSDRKKIRQELSNVEILQIHGPAILYRGLEKANEQIQNANSGDNSPVILKGYGFHNAKNINQVICRFKFSDSKVINKNPTDMNFTVIICPRPEIEEPGKTILVEVSLNNGRDFLAHTHSLNISYCGNVTVYNFNPLSCHQLPLMWSQSSHPFILPYSSEKGQKCNSALRQGRLWELMRDRGLILTPTGSEDKEDALPSPAESMPAAPDSWETARSFRYRGPGWKLLHRLGNTFPAFHQRQIKRMKQNLSQRQSGEDCQGVFDLYIILDNPKMRMSIIIYSTFAEVITPLTSDREAIRKGLEKLNDEVPEGFTHMQDGFQKANEQIRKATSEGSNINSVIIAMTDGLLLDKHLKLTVEEANKSRQMGATIFTVGVYKYDAKQMLQIADSPYHNFEVKKGFTALNNIVDGLASKSCIEVISVKPSYVCTKDESPLGVDDSNINCPGPKIQHVGEEVSLEVSLNNGISFIGNKLTITGINCGSTKSSVGPSVFGEGSSHAILFVHGNMPQCNCHKSQLPSF
ncbi:anthrax toxin receptor-like protein [Cricetulus griseus]|nr:anthrax toxin receptor-like protein [Cricetulus griseus]